MTTWQRLLRRLYVLALASVALAVVAAFVVARSTPLPPSPGILRAALFRLAAALDDDAARTAEVKRLLDDAGLAVAVYDARRALVVANVEPAPRFRPPLEPLAPLDRLDPAGPPLPPPLPPPPPGAPPPPGVPDFDGDGPHHGHDGPPPLAPLLGHRGDRGDRGDGGPAFSTELVSPAGARFVAVVEVPGMNPNAKLGLLGVAILVLLALASVPFATTLSRPLAEVARAATSFGRGDGSARADLEKAGAFAELAQAFNEMAERVSASRKAERELLANVSHELRTPLARIRVALDLAAEGDAELARQSLADIEEDLGELERLVGDILTAARLDALGTTPLRKEAVALGAVLDDAARKFRAHHPDRELVVDAGAVAGLQLALDAVLMRRAVDNFLDNAGKYGDAGESVRLTARVEGGDAVILVEDRGAGIPDDDLARLFTPFFRADKSRNKATGGVGLGLVLSKRIVEAHGGTVSIASVVGHGTSVTVRLPIVRA